MPAAVDVFIRCAGTAWRCIRGWRAVGLQFVVTPAARAGIVGPVRRADRTVRGAVELIAPRRRPRNVARLRGGSALRLRNARSSKKK